MRDRPGCIEVTSAMSEAGVYAAKEFCLGEGLPELVRRVFIAMKTEELNADGARVFNKLGNVCDEQTSNR